MLGSTDWLAHTPVTVDRQLCCIVEHTRRCPRHKIANAEAFGRGSKASEAIQLGRSLTETATRPQTLLEAYRFS